VEPAKSDKVYGYLRQRVDAGEQGYVVVPTIDREPTSAELWASESSEAGDDDRPARSSKTLKSVAAHAELLQQKYLAGRSVGVVHGRLPAEQRQQVMERFRAGAIDVLVATTVIEVGVDVPNATMMVVEHAERFGLAQLHQLRGRVGRGGARSHCVLIGHASTPDAAERLGVLASTADGFELAEKDLEIRGPGELFGSRQSGGAPLKVADLMRDRELLAMARRDAREWVDRSPGLARPEEAVLRRRMWRLYGESLGLGDVG
jgi:ATP-dependent DNA helicase RecG